MSASFADLVTTDDRRERYLADGSWDDRTLAGQVSEHARRAPDSVAVVDGAGAHTTAELAHDAARLARSLADRGLGQGSVGSIQLPNRYESVVAAVALQSLGAVINPLLPNYRRRELGTVFRIAHPAVIFTPGTHRRFDHRPLVTEVAADTGVSPIHVIVGDEIGAGMCAYESLVDGPVADLAAGRADVVSEVIFTSGTEAAPKAVMHTEQTAGFSVRAARDDLGVGGDDVVWMPSPVGHSTGFNYGVRFALHHGLRLVLQDQWDPAAAVDLVTSQRCSYTLAATTFLQDLVDHAARRSVSLDSLRYFGCGGAPVPPHLVDRAGDQGVTVLRLYGSTEVLVATWNRRGSSAEHRRATDGLAMTGVEVAVIGDSGHPVGAEQEGEIVVRGPNTCVGFYDDATRTRATFDREGWVRSGDVGTMNGDGHLTVVGRKKEIIIRGGLNIAPREIEDMIGAFPEVERCAIVGVPDPRLGERMCACVVLAPGRQLDLVTAVDRLRDEGVAAYKLPERLEVLGQFPMTASGKVQKHVLVSSLSGQEEG